MGKFGPIKKQHGRITGLDALLERIMRHCPHVTRIVPGRMGRKRGRTPAQLRVQYETVRGGADSPATGLKCIYTHASSWQEVFIVCSDVAAARRWLVSEGIVRDDTDSEGASRDTGKKNRHRNVGL